MPTAAPPSDDWELIPHPSDHDIDWGLIERLINDRTLVDLAEIAEMCGLASRQSAWLWLRAAQNYLIRGYTKWPPTSSELRNQVGDTPGLPSQPHYFVHRAILPPPDIPGGGKRGQDRWYRGTIYAWGMRTRRISPTGEPIPGDKGPVPGRGPAIGRRLVRKSTGSA